MTKSGKRRLGVLLNIAAYIVTFLIIAPFLWIILMSFKTDSQILTEPFSLPETWNLDNYKRALEVLPLFTMYKNTIIIAVLSELLCIVVTFMSSFALTRLKFKSKKLQNGLYIFIISGLMIPTYILLFPIYRMNVLFKLTGTYLSIILPLAASSISFNTLYVCGIFKVISFGAGGSGDY